MPEIGISLGHVKPFSYPEADDSVAFCFRPDVMEEEELQHFPTFRRWAKVKYLLCML